MFSLKFWTYILLEKRRRDISQEGRETKDALVKSWPIISMTDRLISHFVQCGTTKEVWDAVNRSYLDFFDSSQVYELIKKSFQSHQGGRALTEYYNELNSIFMEFDY